MVVDDVLGGRESGLVALGGRGKGDNNQGAVIFAASGPRKLLQIMSDLCLDQTSDKVTTTSQARGWRVWCLFCFYAGGQSSRKKIST